MNELIARFRDRASRLSFQANLVFGTIVAVIIGGGIFLVYANEVSERGVTRTTQEIDQLSFEVSSRLDEIEESYTAAMENLTSNLTIYSSLDENISKALGLGEGYLASLAQLRLESSEKLASIDISREMDLDALEAQYESWKAAASIAAQDYIDDRVVSVAPGIPISDCTESTNLGGGGVRFTNTIRCKSLLEQLTKIDLANFETVNGRRFQLPEFTVPELVSTRIPQSDMEFFENSSNNAIEQVAIRWAEVSASLSGLRDQMAISAPQFDLLILVNEQLEENQTTFSKSVSDFNAAQGSIERQDWFSFTKASVLRVGVIVLMIFLVQILVTLFRYSTRLAAFYNARADALELIVRNGAAHSPTDLSLLIGSLSPDNLDFGKPARSPVDQAAEISRNIALISMRQK